MNTPHTLADALIVFALAGAFVAWLYFRHKERQRRIDIVHQERLIAMDKGIPLPELPSEPVKPPADPSRDGQDHAAFGELVQRYRMRVFRLAVSILGQEFAPDAERRGPGGAMLLTYGVSAVVACVWFMRDLPLPWILAALAAGAVASLGTRAYMTSLARAV